MVQKPRTTIITGFLIRLLALVVTLLLGVTTADYFEFFNRVTLNFHPSEPLGAYGGIINALVLSWVFWSSIAFGGLGKRSDYFLVGVFFLSALVIYYGDTNAQMYFGLVGTAILGSGIGYVLKLLRLRFFATK